MSKNPVRTVLISNDPKRSSRIQKALVGADPSAITVTPARAFSDAVDMIRSNSVDAFLLDFTLGGLRGLDLLNRAASAIPVVVIVDGDSAKADGEEAVQAGAVAYLTEASLSADFLRRVLDFAARRPAVEAKHSDVETETDACGAASGLSAASAAPRTAAT